MSAISRTRSSRPRMPSMMYEGLCSQREFALRARDRRPRRSVAVAAAISVRPPATGPSHVNSSSARFSRAGAKRSTCATAGSRTPPTRGSPRPRRQIGASSNRNQGGLMSFSQLWTDLYLLPASVVLSHPNRLPYSALHIPWFHKLLHRNCLIRRPMVRSRYH